jgi:alkanesulfonate monooxygenase SsuD/methylene tetrahydromethanopterin reductase-like flavin-dependent oxidoreductase (luciferase family)
VAASSEPAIEWAAVEGHTIMMDPHSAHVEIARKRELYRERLEANGHSFEGREIPMARLLAVAPDAEQAKEVARQGAGWIVGSYMGADGGKLFDPKGLATKIVHGTPEAVVDELQRLQEEMYLDYLMCAPLSHESFTLFTEKVLPKLM